MRPHYESNLDLMVRDAALNARLLTMRGGSHPSIRISFNASAGAALFWSLSK